MITVLYVDDEPALLDIAKRFLEKNSEFKVFTALSAQEGLEIIRTKKPQAVVSDYYMPGIDGMSFLREIRKTSSIPFIMFTGRGSEIVAMEATNSGADYYIQKGADPRALFAELTYKLRLAISDRKSETEEQRLKKTIRTLIDKTYGAVIIHSPDGRIVDVNAKMLELFHLSRNEALKMSIDDLSGPISDPEKRMSTINTVLSGEDQFFIWEARIPHNNSLIKVEKFLTRIPYGNNTYILCNMRALSLKERAKETESAIHYAVNHTSDGIVCCHEDGRIIFINTTLSEKLAIQAPEYIGQNISDLYPTLTPDIWQKYVSLIQNGENSESFSHLSELNGSPLPCSITWHQYTFKDQKFVCLYLRD